MNVQNLYIKCTVADVVFASRQILSHFVISLDLTLDTSLVRYKIIIGHLEYKRLTNINFRRNVMHKQVRISGSILIARWPYWYDTSVHISRSRTKMYAKVIERARGFYAFNALHITVQFGFFKDAISNSGVSLALSHCGFCLM